MTAFRKMDGAVSARFPEPKDARSVPATPPPADNNAAAARNPCDVGGLADPGVSPPPVYPESSLPVPGDADYPPLPSTIRPGPGVVILPPSSDVPVSTLPELAPDKLPPSITPDPDVPNHFPDPTPPPLPPPSA